MIYQEFLQCIRDRVAEREKGKRVDIRKVTKNNNVLLDGLIIRDKGSYITPTIYLNDYYKDYMAGRDLTGIVSEICEIYARHMNDRIVDEDFFRYFDQVKGRVVYKLVNREKNRDLLKRIPHIPYLDLEIVFYYLLNNGGDVCGTVLIYNQHLDAWGIGLSALYYYAKKNTPILLPPIMLRMDEIMKEYLESSLRSQLEEMGRLKEENPGEEEKIDALIDYVVKKVPIDGEREMFVLTNERRYLGAGVILYHNFLRKIADRIGKDLIVLPSSVHEVIIVPDREEYSVESLSDFVKKVNEKEVREEERLADHAYIFRRKEGFVNL